MFVYWNQFFSPLMYHLSESEVNNKQTQSTTHLCDWLIFSYSAFRLDKTLTQYNATLTHELSEEKSAKFDRVDHLWPFKARGEYTVILFPI